MTSEESAPNQVLGERATTAVNRAISVQSRLSSILAVTLMSVLGLGSLTWYYANTMTRQSRARQSAQSASANRAQGETALPSLGRIDPPPPSPSLGSVLPPPDLPPDSAPLTASTLPEIPVGGGAYGAPPPKTPAQIAQERQLSGAVFSNQSAPAPAAVTEPASAGPALPPWMGPAPPAAAPQEPGELSALLRPSVATAVRAQVLPAQRLLLPKGAFIDCTLETAIDSTLPGMTTCVMATDAFGVDGSVVLLERGTKLIGETRGQVQQGSARVFVLWTEARTPAGVVVPLASPGADELGRAGLPGEVNRHFWERFGAALLVSVIDGAVQTAAQSSRNGNGTIIIDPAASQGVMTEVLKSTVNIPPTVVKQNGDRIQVLVARDLDFRSVYELRSATPGR
ncbi:MAG: type IV secretion system protein VirB10 [Steroidobacteraceae bacterium]